MMPIRKQLQIAIDGPSASGKSTVAKGVAKRIDAYYVNTGMMYRLLAWLTINDNIALNTAPNDVEKLLRANEICFHVDKDCPNGTVLYLNNARVDETKLRKPDVTARVSAIAKIPNLRSWMVALQRDTASLGRIVMEGRDIGTVVFPDAQYKFFVTASVEERARRRFAQHDENDDTTTLQSLIADLTERDRIDSTRKVAPLKPAAEAVVIDTTNLSIAEAIESIVSTLNIGAYSS